MPDQALPNGHAQEHTETDVFRNPLPVGSQESILGAVESWPETLKVFSLTVASFPYPAAVFYGEALAIFHNQAWAHLAGVSEQGQEQRGRLGADAWDALSAALRGGAPKRLDATQLLGKDTSADDPESGIYKPVLVSPLFDSDGGEAVGLLAQLVPQDLPRRGGRHQASKPQKKPRDLDISELGNVHDIPLDEHPFFRRFAELLPSGLAILDHKAQAVFVNQLFYDLTTHHNSDKAFMSWPQSIHADDYDRVMNAYQEAFASQKQLRTEFRAITDSNPWRLLLLTPLGDESLRNISLREYGGFICSIVDISSEKSAELAERKDAEEARERKQQQERFIDMISHEIRNPLSAILHCTEDIDDAMDNADTKLDIAGVREATETIQLCITHQRHIVDDVLAYSKLDSAMLSLNPKPCEPSTKVASSLKMFGPEFKKSNIAFQYCIDESYVDNGIEFVMADMARIGQVVVNLVSNAIKFTGKTEREKGLTVSVGASMDRPTSYPPNIVYFNADDLAFRLDATNKSAWGNGETAYILCAVKDTGVGISEEGQRRLFERFRQATPKTAEIYGGSGLGLNISRKMCHMHGGEIGVSSKEGEGSTFGFFFKVKRTEPSQENPKKSAEDEAVDSEVMKSEARALGRITGSAAEDEEKAPPSIKSPPVVNALEATPYPDGSEDERYQKTAQLAERVKEPTADDYANSERPKISEQHRSGTHLESAVLKKEDAKAQGTACSDEKQSEPPRQHVLLVEDNVINQRIVFRKLETKGFTVTTANNGRQAVDAVQKAPKVSTGDKNAFSIILMDQEMPVLDGNAATREIRGLEKDGTVERIPILGLTANVRDAQLQEMLEHGMDDVISKPYKIEDLVKRIGKMTEGEEKG